jgi:hypothetical protein
MPETFRQVLRNGERKRVADLTGVKKFLLG